MATTRTSLGQPDSSYLDSNSIKREQRPQSEEMDIALLQQGGVYEVRLESDGVLALLQKCMQRNTLQ